MPLSNKARQNFEIDPLAQSLLIPTSRIEQVEKAVANANKSLLKLDGDLSVEVTFTAAEPLKVSRQDGGEVFVIPMTRVNLSGAAPVFKGWHFVSQIEFSEQGNYFRTSPWLSEQDNQKLFDDYKETDCHCEHCDTKRQRKSVCILKHVDSGQWVQVGSTCAQDYTGSPAIVRAIEIIGSLTAFFVEASDYEDDLLGGGATGSWGFPLKDFLCVSAALIKESGYISSAEAAERDALSTGIEAAMVLSSKDSKTREFARNAITQCEADSEAVIAMVEGWEIPKNSFQQNAKVIIGSRAVFAKQENLTASLMHIHLREQATGQERAERQYVVYPHAEDGARLKNKAFLVVAKKDFESYYGWQTFYLLVDAEGFVFKAKSTTNLERGEWLVLDATLDGTHSLEQGTVSVLKRFTDQSAKIADLKESISTTQSIGALYDAAGDLHTTDLGIKTGAELEAGDAICFGCSFMVSLEGKELLVSDLEPVDGLLGRPDTQYRVLQRCFNTKDQTNNPELKAVVKLVKDIQKREKVVATALAA